jgi:hypothetical protein
MLELDVIYMHIIPALRRISISLCSLGCIVISSLEKGRKERK